MSAHDFLSETMIDDYRTVAPGVYLNAPSQATSCALRISPPSFISGRLMVNTVSGVTTA